MAPKRKVAIHVMLLMLLGMACAAQLWGRRTVAFADLSTGIQKLDEGKSPSLNYEELVAILAKLSDGPDQQSWWQLELATWHENAARRFFEVGPLSTAEMLSLAHNVKGEHKELWNMNNQKFNLGESFKKNIATANFSKNRFIPGTGNIQATMLTGIFKCATTPCGELGSIVPVVIIPDPKNDSAHLMGSIWLHLGLQNVLLNAIPASLHNSVTKSFSFPDVSAVSNDGLIKVSYTAYSNLQNYCPAASTIYRPLLESVYGLLPGWFCIIFPKEKSSFRSLLFSLNTPSSIDAANYSHDPSSVVKNTLSKLNVTIKGSWMNATFQRCSEAPVMEPYGGPDLLTQLTMCKAGTCISFDTSDVSCSIPGMLSLNCLNAALSPRSGRHSGFKVKFGDEDKWNFTCEKVSDPAKGSYCNFTLILYNSSITGYTNKSVWTKPQGGSDTSEFSRMAPMWQKFHVCVQKLSPVSNMASGSDYPLPQILAPDTMKIEAIDALTSYITAHNTLFTTENGPATDQYTFYGLIVSTALSVITIAAPLTSFLLKLACHLRLLHLALAHGTRPAGKATMVVLQMCCNVLLSLAFFLPVLMLAIDEVKRQKTFRTWNMAASDIDYNDPTSGTDNTIRVLYLMSATSKYISHFRGVIMAVLSITCVSVAGITAWQCVQIFKRYQLLKKPYSHIQDSHVTASDHKLAMMAIEMRLADYLKLQEELESLTSPEVQLAMSRRFLGTD